MKKWLWLLPAVLLLLAVYIVLGSPFVDKVYDNPISNTVDALEFVLTDGTSIRLHDAETIAKLRTAHRWTNYHMYCCLEPDNIYAYVYEVVNGKKHSGEPMKIYNSWQTPSFNLAFRLLLRQTCDELFEN